MGRTKIKNVVLNDIFYKSMHTCCICNERGQGVIVHHIDGDRNNNDPLNLAVLCSNCHANVHQKGYMSRHYTPELVLKYKTEWEKRVEARRVTADYYASMKMVGNTQVIDTKREESSYAIKPENKSLVEYVNKLPFIAISAKENAKKDMESEVVIDTLKGCYSLIEVFTEIMVHLSSWFPEKHFNNMEPSHYISQFVKQRFIWRASLAEPEGHMTGGSIAHQCTYMEVFNDLRISIKEMVHSLLWDSEFDLKNWKLLWDSILNS